MKRRSVHSKVKRLRDWLHIFAHWMDDMPCYVCGEQLDPEAFCIGDASDGLVAHHIDMSRGNANPENIAICHRGCHRKFHVAYEERGVDIRDKRAIAYWGKTPRVQSCKSRRSGTLRTHNRSK